jgi:hypothetical protein
MSTRRRQCPNRTAHSHPRPYAIEPLLEAAGIDRISSLGPNWSRDLHRLKKLGGMTERQADKWACRFWLHPGDVWPDLYWQAGDLADRDAGALVA